MKYLLIVFSAGLWVSAGAQSQTDYFQQFEWKQLSNEKEFVIKYDKQRSYKVDSIVTVWLKYIPRTNYLQKMRNELSLKLRQYPDVGRKYASHTEKMLCNCKLNSFTIARTVFYDKNGVSLLDQNNEKQDELTWEETVPQTRLEALVWLLCNGVKY